MSDTIFPHSPVMDSVPGEGDIVDLANEALNAFFKVVVDKLDDWYPGSKTWGDIDPMESISQEEIAKRWIRSFAINNTAVGAATEAAEEIDDDGCGIYDADGVDLAHPPR